MPAEINFKKKYLELRSKYIADLDMAFRLGVEQGAQQAQQQQGQMNQEKLQQQQLEAGGMAGQHAPEEESEAPGQQEPKNDEMPEEGAQPAMETNGSELDQHINKLESALGSSASPEVKKSLEIILSLRKAEKQALEMKKAERAIPGIVKALHKPAFKMGVQAFHNLSDNAKQTVTLQHKIVNDVMKAWADEESKASNELESILNIENLLKE
jgi:hypothetical protein